MAISILEITPASLHREAHAESQFSLKLSGHWTTYRPHLELMVTEVLLRSRCEINNVAENFELNNFWFSSNVSETYPEVEQVKRLFR